MVEIYILMLSCALLGFILERAFIKSNRHRGCRLVFPIPFLVMTQLHPAFSRCSGY